MVLLNRFMFWFSLRLGSLIVGIFTLIQCSVWFMVLIISLDNLDVVREALQTFLINLNLEKSFLSHLAKDPHIYLIYLNVEISLLLISTILMIIGSFQCKFELLIPFLATDLIYIIEMTLQHVFLMINYKKEEPGRLGSLILYSNGGGFILLILVYMWISVLCFCQILRELEKDLSTRFSNRNLRKQVLGIIKNENEERF